jgi:hypothetical protein
LIVENRTSRNGRRESAREIGHRRASQQALDTSGDRAPTAAAFDRASDATRAFRDIPLECDRSPRQSSHGFELQSCPGNRNNGTAWKLFCEGGVCVIRSERTFQSAMVISFCNAREVIWRTSGARGTISTGHGACTTTCAVVDVSPWASDASSCVPTTMRSA